MENDQPTMLRKKAQQQSYNHNKQQKKSPNANPLNNPLNNPLKFTHSSTTSNLNTKNPYLPKICNKKLFIKLDCLKKSPPFNSKTKTRSNTAANININKKINDRKIHLQRNRTNISENSINNNSHIINNYSQINTINNTINNTMNLNTINNDNDEIKKNAEFYSIKSKNSPYTNRAQIFKEQQKGLKRLQGKQRPQHKKRAVEQKLKELFAQKKTIRPVVIEL